MTAVENRRALKQASAPMWMVTFADLMALMLVLFVLLLTFSEMNVVRYQSVIGSLKDALGTVRESSLAGVVELEGTLLRKSARDVDPTNRTSTGGESGAPSIESVIPVRPEDLTRDEVEMMEMEYRMMLAEDLAGNLQDTLAETPDTEGVQVEQRMDEVVMTFPSEIAFASGRADITSAFGDIIKNIAPAIRDTKGMIVISGHTDNQPMSGGRFRSNWDLSAARAASLTPLLLGSGIESSRMAIHGYADSRPLAPNETPEGRAKNRRVEVSILLDDSDNSAAPRFGEETDNEVFRQNF
ncbi:MAG: OmpA family protein [Rhodospirillales bacterium]